MSQNEGWTCEAWRKCPACGGTVPARPAYFRPRSRPSTSSPRRIAIRRTSARVAVKRNAAGDLVFAVIVRAVRIGMH
jgi:hypothetical protein